MPGGMGGKEAVKALQAHHSGVRAVVSSGYSDDPIMSEYGKYGFDCVIAKPFCFFWWSRGG